MNKQKGMTFIGLVFVVAVLMFGAIAGMKLVPAYLEYSSVKKAIDYVAAEPNFSSMSNSEIKAAFTKSASIDDIKVVTADDLIIMTVENGKPVVTVDYQTVVPLFGNVSALLSFVASTDKAAYQAAPKKTEADEAPSE